MIRVMIVDDHDVVRAGIRQMLSASAEVAVVADVATAAEALDVCQTSAPDVALLDVNLPDRSGFDLLPDIERFCPRTRTIVVSIHTTAPYATRALRLGAWGYIGKDRAGEHLLDAIRSVVRGRKFVEPAIAAQMTDYFVSGRVLESPLSDREWEILRMIAAGKAPRQIAADLGISTRTIGAHRANILKKLGLKSNAELVQYAIENRLI